MGFTLHKEEKHFYLRLMQRFGVSEQEFDRDGTEEKILSYENYPLYVDYRAKSLHRLELKGVPLIAVYSWTNNRFVTALPADYMYETPDGKWLKNKKYKAKKIRIFNRKTTRAKKISKIFQREIDPSELSGNKRKYK